MSLGMTRYIPKSFSPLSLFFVHRVISETRKFVLQVGVDLVEGSMRMIGGLQLMARTQSSQYVLNELNWVNDDAPLMIFA